MCIFLKFFLSIEEALLGMSIDDITLLLLSILYDRSIAELFYMLFQ